MDDLDRELEALVGELEREPQDGTGFARGLLDRVEGLRGALEKVRKESRDLASLYQVAQGLSASSNIRELLDLIIDRATALVGAERGFVVLSTPGGAYSIAASKQMSTESLAPSGTLSSSLLARVIEERQAVLTTNVQEDDRFDLTQSIIMQQIRSVLAVPLVAQGELVGAIYVDTQINERLFSESDLSLLEAMASQAAIAIRNARLYADTLESNQRLRLALRELEETQQQLVQAERLAAVGRLAASVAHELRNPLTIMRNAIYFLDRLVSSGTEYSPDTIRRYLSKLDLEVERQLKIINDLLFFSRDRPRNIEEVDLNALLLETLLRVPMPESVRVIKRLEPSLPQIRADADQLQQVFVNLITNAVQAMRQGGTLTVATASEDESVVAEITDTGVGISKQHLEKLFEPFFTTKESGIGLGLAVTKSLVEGHGGNISVTSKEGEGTSFFVELPRQLLE